MSRYFLVLAIILIGLYTLVFLTGNKKPDPKLGLDLQGGTSLTLSAVTQAGGKAPTKENLDLARQIISNRVNGSGVSEPEVVTEGSTNIVVSVAGGASEDELKKLVAPAQLEFREVKAQTQDHPVTEPSPAPSASPSVSTSAKPSTSPTPSKSPSASPTPSKSASANPSGSTSASPTLNASESAAAAAQAKILDEVEKKLGVTWSFAGQYLQQVQSATQQGQDPSSLLDASTLKALEPFGYLTPTEVGALPLAVQYYIPTVSCKQLNDRDPGAVSDPKAQVVVCDQGDDAHTKYVLDVAKVLGTDVKSALANYDTGNGGWNVSLKFSSAGGSKWTALTTAIADEATSDSQTHYLAIVLDNSAVSVASVTKAIVGDAVINGTGINEQTSKTLANQLKYGSLPLSFKIQSVTSVSATLGLQQLKYGLLAGGIGLILVVLYCLFYYRALGLVVIASLGVSAALVFAALVLLGRGIGFTLSLAGIAGFIVAIGITADSFVVFFERLKDEVKDGRSVRSAVPRAWIRARRTILSADAVSILAAAILYWLAAGAVKGFAFTLGLSTILDLLIVFLFTHPLVSLLARSKAFTSPRVSGLGNMRPDSAIEAGTGRTRLGAVRTKES